MPLNAIKRSQFTIFIASNNDDHHYHTVASIYHVIHLARQGFPAYLLDLKGTSENLVSPPRSIKIGDLGQLDLSNPNKVFVIFASNLTVEELAELRRGFQLPETFSPEEESQILADTPFNSVGWLGDLFAHRRRACNGQGALVHIVGLFGNVFELGTRYQSVQQLEHYDFSGYFIKGLANTSQWQKLTVRSRAAQKPLLSYNPVVMDIADAKPKKLKVVYSSTLIRFMAIENVIYFLNELDANLTAQIEFVNVAEYPLNRGVAELSDAFAFIALDQGYEFPTLVPEAMWLKCLVFGFGGNFHNPSTLNSDLVSFSPETDYRDIANKIYQAACEYKQQLALDPYYVSAQAEQASLFAKTNFTEPRLVERYLEMLRAIGVRYVP